MFGNSKHHSSSVRRDARSREASGGFGQASGLKCRDWTMNHIPTPIHMMLSVRLWLKSVVFGRLLVFVCIYWYAMFPTILMCHPFQKFSVFMSSRRSPRYPGESVQCLHRIWKFCIWKSVECCLRIWLSHKILCSRKCSVPSSNWMFCNIFHFRLWPVYFKIFPVLSDDLLELDFFAKFSVPRVEAPIEQRSHSGWVKNTNLIYNIRVPVD